jgi:hypothetical protein
MPKNRIDNVRTKPVGFAPILAHYFDQCDISVLDVMLPGIQLQEYFDDRLADTLDALYDCGFFVCPLPMYAKYEQALAEALENHDREVLLPYKGRINRGFEAPLIIEHKDRCYPFRMIVLFDHGLFHRKEKSLSQRVEKTRQAMDARGHTQQNPLLW